MDYETIDWDAEAIRVAWAFRMDYQKGQRHLAEFVENVKDDALSLDEQPDYRDLNFKTRDNLVSVPCGRGDYFRTALLSCRYSKRKGMTFALDTSGSTPKKAPSLTDITLHWRGYIVSRIRDRNNALFLAKGLYHLGFLTPEVEAAFEVPISAQEKAAWDAEERGINFCETLDWEAEAKRIAMAFGTTKYCRFEHWRGSSYKMGKLMSGNTHPPLLAHRRLKVWYSAAERSFEVETAGPRDGDFGKTLARITLKWDGSFETEVVDGNLLAKGLYYLDLLTPEIETALKVSITAEQKLEWTRQYRLKYGL